MNEEHLRQLLEIIKTQSAINHRIETILKDLGANNTPKMKILQELITINQSLLVKFEKDIDSERG